MAFRIAADSAAQFAVTAEYHGALRRHRLGIFQHWMMQVSLRALGIYQWNRPLNVELRISEIDERVGLLLFEAPMGVNQIGVSGAILQRLEAIADSTRHIYCLAGV